jgi:hypothetical protein
MKHLINSVLFLSLIGTCSMGLSAMDTLSSLNISASIAGPIPKTTGFSEVSSLCLSFESEDACDERLFDQGMIDSSAETAEEFIKMYL